MVDNMLYLRKYFRTSIIRMEDIFKQLRTSGKNSRPPQFDFRTSTIDFQDIYELISGYPDINCRSPEIKLWRSSIECGTP